MHGGDWDGTKWTCPGCTDGYPTVFPAALALANTTGAHQRVLPNAHRWPVNVSGGILRAWVNGWFTEMWELGGYDDATGRIALGRGGFHGGQPHMLDSVNPDGTPGAPDEFLNSTVNVTNRLDPGSMGQIIVENLLAELDAPGECVARRRAGVATAMAAPTAPHACALLDAIPGTLLTTRLGCSTWRTMAPRRRPRRSGSARWCSKT